MGENAKTLQEIVVDNILSERMGLTMDEIEEKLIGCKECKTLKEDMIYQSCTELCTDCAMFARGRMNCHEVCDCHDRPFHRCQRCIPCQADGCGRSVMTKPWNQMCPQCGESAGLIEMDDEVYDLFSGCPIHCRKHTPPMPKLDILMQTKRANGKLLEYGYPSTVSVSNECKCKDFYENYYLKNMN